jgi:NAD(P)-dependent dehydrogenase (short-subunit alcohol dehydrogenase family)
VITESLKNQVIVVIGGAGAIGRCFVEAISSQDGVVISADIAFDSEKNTAVNSKENLRSMVDSVYVDITQEDSVASLIVDTTRKYGRIDAVVNAAYPRNKNYGASLEKVTYTDFCENLNTHLGGYFLVSQHFCLAFKDQGFGNMINISSIYGSITPRFELYAGTTMTMPVEYAAIKSGIIHLTRYFSQYYKGYGIRVNSLSPGGIKNNQPESFLKAYKDKSASKGMLNEEDLNGALLFLLSGASKHVNGQNLIVDDGFSL